MKRLMTVVLGAAMLGGCSFTMKEFSSTPLYSGSEVTFTGAVEDRVNLWPLGYWREPVGSIAWPLVSWGKDHFAMRPLYSQYKQGGSGDYNEFNVLWPVGQFDTKPYSQETLAAKIGSPEFPAKAKLDVAKAVVSVYERKQTKGEKPRKEAGIRVGIPEANGNPASLISPTFLSSSMSSR